MKTKVLFIFLIFLVCTPFLSAQPQKLDSLKAAFKSEINDSLRVHLLLNIARSSGKISSRDELAYTRQALELAQGAGYKKGIALAYDHLGVIDRNSSNYSSSLANHNLALQYISPYGICKEKAVILNNIGVVYRRLDELSKATDFHLRALSIAEEMNDQKSISISTNSLGNIFLSQGNYTEALKNFHKALEEEKKADNKLGEAINLNNIGYVYSGQKDYTKAIQFFNQSLAVNKSIDNQKGMAICYNCLGEVYLKQKIYAKAVEMYKLALEINQKHNDRIYAAESYINIGEILSLQGNLDESESNIRRGLELAVEIGSKHLIEKAYSRLSDLYFMKGDYKSAYLFVKESYNYRDSIINDKNNSTIARLKTIYETEKKEKEIQSHKLELAVQRKELLKEKALKFFFIAGFSGMMVLSFLLYRNYRLKKKANVVLTNYNRDIDEKNKILVMQKEEILAQRDQIQEKNKVANKAYDLIKTKNKNIIENIRYAFQIQNALLPSPKDVKQFLPESFVIYKPRDIVSGDFYWLTKKDNKLVIAAADCTGHGVSGAFMSILGISALNEIVNERGITQTNVIMDALRERIIDSLQQKDKFWEAKDGIDMAILSLDLVNRKMMFTGANSSVILIRDGELTQLKGDKMPVSIFPEIIPFSSFEGDIRPDDAIYLYSDGYYHQFGGLYGKKFSIRQFISLLQNIHKLSAGEQHARLEETFRKWRGRAEQVDDILVMGMMLKGELFQMKEE